MIKANNSIIKKNGYSSYYQIYLGSVQSKAKYKKLQNLEDKAIIFCLLILPKKEGKKSLATKIFFSFLFFWGGGGGQRGKTASVVKGNITKFKQSPQICELTTLSLS